MYLFLCTYGATFKNANIIYYCYVRGITSMIHSIDINSIMIMISSSIIIFITVSVCNFNFVVGKEDEEEEGSIKTGKKCQQQNIITSYYYLRTRTS